MEWIKGNRYLSSDEMKNNAILVYRYLSARGWSLNAIAGVLGNMEIESTINPGIWQNLEINPLLGFGLVQWTPANNYTVWASHQGFALDDGNGQLQWIDEETVKQGQWIATSEYNISFEEFKRSSQPPSWCASAFLKNFERAGVEKEEDRREKASLWKIYIQEHEGMDPDQPDTPTPTKPKKKKKFNFVLFNARRRHLI